jgi:hypothetical protein
MTYEFDWVSEALSPTDLNRLIDNFLADPAAFLNLEFPEWDEEIIVDIEDVTGEYNEQ